MFNLLILFATKALKVFGISSAVYDVYLSLFDVMGINLTLLVYTIAIEGIFIFLKSSQYKVPIWIEAIGEFI